MQLVNNLQDVWRDEWRGSNELSPKAREKGHLICPDACQQVSTLIDEHRAGRIRSSAAPGLFFSTFLDYTDIDNIPHNFLSEWKAVKDGFFRYVHLCEDPFDAATDAALVKHFNCLHGYLYIAASSQYDRLKELNELLDATNR
ncbi:hypothetical protein [Candidatus Foliamicus sp.]